MHDDEYESAKSWLESDDEEINLHAIEWLERYYDNNFEAKEDRIVDLLLSQLDREISICAEREYYGSEYLRLIAVGMLGENTRPYEGRIVIEIVRVAREDDSERVVNAAIRSLGNFCHPASVRFLIDECIDACEETAKRSLFSLRRIAMNGISVDLSAETKLPRGMQECLRDAISRHILDVATYAKAPVPFKVKKAALYILQDNTLKKRHDENELTPLSPRWLDMTPHIIRALEFQLETEEWQDDEYGYSVAECEEIKSLMEMALKWNNGEIEPFEELANSLFGNVERSGPSTKEGWQQLIERHRWWVERYFPELNEEEQYEQLVPCIESALRGMDRSLSNVIRGSNKKSNTFWFDKDGPKAYELYL